MTYPQYSAAPPPPPPGGGTALTAAVLAIVGGVVHLIGAIAGVLNVGDFQSVLAIVISVGVNPVLAGLLLGGGIMIFLRKPAGRLAVIVGAALAITVYASAIVFGAVGVYARGVLPAGFVMLIAALPAIATVVLASLSSTVRWLTARQDSPPPPFGVPGYQLQAPPGGYPPPAAPYREDQRPW